MLASPYPAFSAPTVMAVTGRGDVR